MCSKIKIIAEAGVNHNGSIERAYQMVDAAKKAGADIIKFQLFEADKLVTTSAPKAEYQKKNLFNKFETQFQMLKKLELNQKNHKDLFNYCKKKKIFFMSTAFDIDSAIFLNNLGVKIFKIPSGDITNYLLLKKIASFKKEIFLSTGMSNTNEIYQAINLLIQSGIKKNMITIMHCNTEYPTPLEDVNLNCLFTLKKIFSTNIGYSDHTLDLDIPSYAIAMGASIIEKHFTLNRKLSGPDHKASLTPIELKKMIKKIKNTQIFLGSYEKKPTNSEKKNIPIARKSIVALGHIKKGDIFSLNNLTVKRPGTGLSPFLIPKLIGKKAEKNYKKDDLIIIKSKLLK